MAPTALITRPADDAEATAKALEPLGIDAVIAPLLTITVDRKVAVDLDGVQALLFTSANGARAFAARSSRRDLPVLAVGDASARTARDLGFADVRSAAGDVETLAALAVDTLKPDAGALFHAAGSVTAGDLGGRLGAAGFSVRKAKLYTARKTAALPKAAAGALRSGAVDMALVYSPRTGENLATLIRKAGLEKSLERVTVYCLSDAVAGKLGNLPWRRVVVAERPDQDALLAAVGADVKGQAAAPGGTERKNDMTDTGKSKDDAKAKQPATPKDEPKEPAKEPAKPAADKGDAGKGDAKASPKPGDKPAAKTADEKGGADKAAPPTRKKGGGGRAILWLLVLAVLGGGAGWLTLPQWRDRVPEPYRAWLPVPAETQDRMTGFNDRLAAQEQQLAEVSERVGGVAKLAAEVSDRVAALSDRLDEAAATAQAARDTAETIQAGSGVDPKEVAELRKSSDQVATLAAELLDRIQKLEDGRIDPATVETLGGRVAGLEKSRVDPAALLNLSERLNRLETQVTEVGSARAEVSRVVVAAMQLRDAVGRGAAFDAELRALRVVAGDMLDVDGLTGAIAGRAETGVPTAAELAVRLDKVVGDVAMAAATPDAAPDSLSGKIMDRLSSVVSIRRTEADGGAAGMAAEAARLARAGDLAGAVAALEGLDGAPAEAASAWLAEAEARLAADRAMGELTAEALALGAGAGN